MVDVQVVFEKETYNYQGMYEEKVGLRIDNKVQWYGHIAHTGGNRQEQIDAYQQMKNDLYEIVNCCIP